MHKLPASRQVSASLLSDIIYVIISHSAHQIDETLITVREDSIIHELH